MIDMRLVAAAAAAMTMGVGAAHADSISPDLYSVTLEVGESVTFTKTVTVSAGSPTDAKLDVFFLADTTGSMSGQISSARSSASAILSGLSAYGDVQMGVGEYKDTRDSFTYRTNLGLTDISDSASIQTAIDTWSARGGGNFPEGNLIALQSVANDTDWRADSTRVVVMFGDAPGHVGGAYPSESDVTGALNAENITLHIGNTYGTSLAGMNAASGTIVAGQANRFAAATGGTVVTLSSSGAGMVDLILDAVDTTFASYSSVDLGIPTIDGLDISYTPLFTTPADGWTREEERSFEFEVTFAATEAGVYDFNIPALVDGGQVALERDIVTVTDDVAAVPLPAALPLYLGALLGAGLVIRRRRRS
ncbi:MAG: VWA domain-containing protein [Pseudorhodobacter sp.]